ncbi:MAG TPA: flagellar hook-length control protein FliK [Planctomycetes bacterium]|nr:flagellar hook-length control protein FliK [Planctomycetota bacterium]
MASIQPQDPAASAAPKRLGALPLAIAPTEDLPGAGELFREEVERAVDRQGGRRQVAERAQSEAAARRAGRDEGFRKHNEEVQRGKRGRRRGARREEDADRAPATQQLAPRQETTRTPAGTPRDRTDREPTDPGAARADGAADRPTRGEDGTEAGRIPSAGASGVGFAAVASGAGSNAASNQGSAAVAPARSVNAVEAFQAGASIGKSGAEGSAAAGKAPAEAAAPKGTPELIEHAAEVLRQIRLSLNAGGKEIRVQLTPEALGRIHIRLRTEGTNLEAVVRVEDPKTLKLLEHQAPELKALLAQQGFAADGISLEMGLAGDSRAPHDQHAASDSAHRGSRTGRIPVPADTTDPSTRTRSIHAIGSGRIDTYA